MNWRKPEARTPIVVSVLRFPSIKRSFGGIELEREGHKEHRQVSEIAIDRAASEAHMLEPRIVRKITGRLLCGQQGSGSSAALTEIVVNLEDFARELP